MYREVQDLYRPLTRGIHRRYINFRDKERTRIQRNTEKLEAWQAKNRQRIKQAIFDSLEFLADQAFVDGPVNGASRALTRMGYPTAAKLLGPASVAAQAGYAVGKYAGEQTAANVAAGMPSTVGLDYTPEIALYERSAIGSSRII